MKKHRLTACAFSLCKRHILNYYGGKRTAKEQQLPLLHQSKAELLIIVISQLLIQEKSYHSKKKHKPCQLQAAKKKPPGSRLHIEHTG